MGSADEFIRLLNERNAYIAAMQVEKENSVDQVRLQRDRERRERWGTLRARERPSRRPYVVHNAFGHVSLNP
jgi:hypothetical protein